MDKPTVRAEAVTLRTYCRPLDDAGTKLESWSAVNKRAAYDHHLWLWENAGGKPDTSELAELMDLGIERKSTVAGRALWLGGTSYARERACCNFNCAATVVCTVYDLVDVAWLLLNGSGVGFKPVVGTLHGYTKRIQELRFIPSTRPMDWKGRPDNIEEAPTESNNWTWTIRIGDSAEAWAKCIGKLFGPNSRKARALVVDASEVRGPGGRLRGYGWICNGSEPLINCIRGIHETLNRKAGNVLDEIDIMDVVNRIGEILSSRRSAQCVLVDSNSPVEREFANAKRDYYICNECGGFTKAGVCVNCGSRDNNNHRRQSNNSELFWSKPSKAKLMELLQFAYECGGDPGIVNAEAARVKCPWFEYFNPCFEIMLGSFCNLVNNCLPRFARNFAELERAVYLIARANYRQTCVDLRDDVLQPRWHQTNDSLRLCGVSLTGIVQAPWMTDYHIRRLRNSAVFGAYSMADQLGTPRPKAVTTVTPGGTISKCMGGMRVGEIAEGIHNPLGRYVLNWINYSLHDPMVDVLRASGYKVIPNPQDGKNVLVCFPVEFRNGNFSHGSGKEVNNESAVSQLERYLRWNNMWADHNVSATVSYSREELPEIVDWLDAHWDRGYIATAFQERVDATKSAEELGHPYLPQDVVSKQKFDAYVETLRPVDLAKATGVFDMEETCSRGTCPSK